MAAPNIRDGSEEVRSTAHCKDMPFAVLLRAMHARVASRRPYPEQVAGSLLMQPRVQALSSRSTRLWQPR